ncbi:ROK family protein [Candidatus Latescibacterota bacterium]
MQHTQQLSESIVIGVDLGGTTISAGAVSGSSIITIKKVGTVRTRSADEIIADMVSLIGSVKGKHTLKAIGIGVPSPAGPGTETFLPASNLPTLDNYPIKAYISEHFGVPVFLENDANCMTMGEFIAGSLRGVRSGACLTLGTGLGCGFIIEGFLVRGKRYAAGEIWNIPYSNGTILEDTVSIKALKRLAKKHMLSHIEPHDLFELYHEGNSSAILAWNLYGRAVGRVVTIVMTLLDPERIIIGGGIAGAFEAFRESMISEVSPVYGEGIADSIQPAQLSDRAAIIGAAILAKNITEESEMKKNDFR